MTNELREHYDTLELEPGADLKTVKRAYRDLAQVWHPDRFSHNERLKAKASAKLKKVNAAYEAVVADLKTAPTPKAKAKAKPKAKSKPKAKAKSKAKSRSKTKTSRDKDAWAAEERARRRRAPLGPWAGLALDHAVLRGPGDGQIVAVSRNSPMDFIRASFDQQRWINAMAWGRDRWLTVTTRWPAVREQSVRIQHERSERNAFIQSSYDEGFCMSTYVELPSGAAATVMTRGVRDGSERWKGFSDGWPRDHIRARAKDHDELIVALYGIEGTWFVVTSQVPGWGGQRISRRTDWDGLMEAVRKGWDEQRRITSIGWTAGLYVIVSTANCGIGGQTYGHYKTVDELKNGLSDQWSRGRIVTAACHDHEGWLVILSEERGLG